VATSDDNLCSYIQGGPKTKPLTASNIAVTDFQNSFLQVTVVYKKMVIVYVYCLYGIRFAIRLNPSKSQTAVFGGHGSSQFLMLNKTTVQKVKYTGIFISCKTNCVDPSSALRKLYGSFNDIMSVFGHGRDELMTVHALVENLLSLPVYCTRLQNLAYVYFRFT